MFSTGKLFHRIAGWSNQMLSRYILHSFIESRVIKGIIWARIHLLDCKSRKMTQNRLQAIHFWLLDWLRDQSAFFEEVLAWALGVVYVCEAARSNYLLRKQEASLDAALALALPELEGISSLKEGQIMTLKAFLDGKKCLCSFPNWLQYEFDLPSGSAVHKISPR